MDPGVYLQLVQEPIRFKFSLHSQSVMHIQVGHLEQKQHLFTSDRGSLFKDQNVLYWMVGNQVNQKITLDEHIVHAVFGYFDLEGECVCVLTEQSLKFYFMSGKQYLTSLPVRGRMLYPLKSGLLLERCLDPLGLYSDAPTVFTLFHPLEETKPVSVMGSGQIGGMVGIPGPQSFFPQDGHVLYCQDDLLVMVSGGVVKMCEFRIMPLEKEIDDIPRTWDRNSPMFIKADQMMLSPLQVYQTTEYDTGLSSVNAVYILQDHQGRNVLWVFQQQTHSLIGYCDNKQVYKMECLSAVPVRSTRKQNDLLILKPGHTLHLWHGTDLLIPCHVQYDQHVIESSLKRTHEDMWVDASKTHRVTGLQVFGGPFVILHLGTKTFKGFCQFIAQSKLVESCLDAVRNTIGNTYELFFSRFLMFKYQSDKMDKQQEWRAFVIVLLSFLHSSAKLKQDTVSLSPMERLILEAQRMQLDGIPLGVRQMLLQEHTMDDFALDYKEAGQLFLQHHKEQHLLDQLPLLVANLHCVQQSLSLSCYYQSESRLLGLFLSVLSSSCGFDKYSQLYRRMRLSGDTQVRIPSPTSEYEPFDILMWIAGCVQSKQPQESPIGFLKGKMQSIQDLERIIVLVNLYYAQGPVQVVKKMVQWDMSEESVNAYTIGAGFLLKQSILVCRGLFLPDKRGQSFGTVQERDDAQRLRFTKDDRLKVAQQMLEPQLSLTDQVDPVGDVNVQQQKELKRWAAKTYALALGKGMITFNSRQIVSTETISIPSMPTGARLPPLNATVELIVSPHLNFMEWPEFHSGVSHGLQVRMDCVDIDSSWFIFNQKRGSDGRPEVESKHGGFLLGMGLMGHSKHIELGDSLRYYLLPQYDMIMVGHLLGLGATFIGTKNPTVSQMVAVHIPSLLPRNSANLNLSAITRTSAIVSFGLLHSQTRSRQQLDKILSDIDNVRQHDLDPENSDTEMYMNGCGFAIGLIDLASGSQTLVDRLIRLKSKKRTDLVENGTTIALGLVCLKTQNKQVANILQCPTSEYLLDAVKPEHLIISTIARHLILWDQKPQDWLFEQIPSYLKRIVQEFESGEFSDEPNYHGLHCYYYLLAGLGFALGVKYRGSFDRECFKTLSRLILLTKKASMPSGFNDRLVQHSARQAMCILVTGLSLVMAGSGDKETLDLIQSLPQKNLNYGNHMALSMSLGLLFVSGGTCTLGLSDLGTAILFCSFYPLYPLSVTDNQFHMQALRHLWPLATEQRCLITRNVLNGQVEPCPIEVVLTSGKQLSLFTPDILPPLDEIEHISIQGPRYLDLKITRGQLSQRPYRPMMVWIQRRTRYLSYDPDGTRGIFGSSVLLESQNNETMLHIRERFVKSFSTEPQILAFVHYFCNDDHPMAKFCLKILHECLTNDQLDMIPIYLWIYKTSQLLMDMKSQPNDSISLRIILDAASYDKQYVSCLNLDYIHRLKNQIRKCVPKSEFFRIYELWPMDLEPIKESMKMFDSLSLAKVTIKRQYPILPLETIHRIVDHLSL
ncbi:hypothetical protein EDD86DRAFT_246749 [Gorgonomyces haynaldii]|nr:hypothetical protein EDD86DRAFT_246749 [Gorgonomyces haynaldii]